MESPEERLHELFNRMNDFGITLMTTEELEEWSYLMAESLEGKGDVTVDIVSTTDIVRRQKGV